MVDSECVEIYGHLCETILPPLKGIFCHPLPVISWKAPVLALDGKWIRWCTRLLIQMIEVRRHPGITTMPVYTNWNISLENDPVFMGVLYGFAQLPVKMVLNKIIISDLIVLFA